MSVPVAEQHQLALRSGNICAFPGCESGQHPVRPNPMASIYTTTIHELTWTDIEEFCKEQKPESAFLDYKADFPDDLAKTVCAMANSVGGIILIGVEETKNTTPKNPIRGILNEKKPADRVFNICLDSITPPVVPEVQVCANESGERAVVVVRVHQSDLTPHAINKNTDVYIRTGNRNDREPKSSVDHLVWLIQQRQRSVSLRERLQKKAQERFEIFFEPIHKRDTSGVNTYLSIIICPKYPKKVFANPWKIYTFMQDAQFRQGENYSLFSIDKLNSKLIQDGVLNCTTSEIFWHFLCFTCFGHFSYRQAISQVSGNGKPTFHMTVLTSTVIDVLLAAQNFYDGLEIVGTLDVEMKIHLANESEFVSPKRLKSRSFTTDKTVEYSDTISVHKIDQSLLSLVNRFVKTVGYAYDWNINKEDFKKCYEAIGLTYQEDIDD